MRSRNDNGHNLVLDVVVVNLNMLCTFMKGGISRIKESGLIISNAWALEKGKQCQDL